MIKETTVRTRFGWFAVGHFCVSAVGLVCLAALIFPSGICAEISGFLKWSLCAALMALYAVAGCLCARCDKWSRPSHKQGFLAVLLPALIAWGVAVFGIATMNGVGFIFLLSTAIWASPSFLLMLNALNINVGNGTAIFCACAFLAGLLPPFLFCFGSFLGAHPVDNGENCDILT